MTTYPEAVHAGDEAPLNLTSAVQNPYCAVYVDTADAPNPAGSGQSSSSHSSFSFSLSESYHMFIHTTLTSMLSIRVGETCQEAARLSPMKSARMMPETDLAFL